MATLLRMPEPATGVNLAVLLEWSVPVGADHAAGDVIAVVETDKASIEITADEPGTVLSTLVTAGAEVEVGSPIAVVGTPGEVVEDLDSLLAALGVTAPPAGADEPRVPAPDTITATVHPPRIFASPIARRMAKEAALDIAALPGTGPGGRIVRADVETALRARPTAQPQAPVPAQPPEPEPELPLAPGEHGSEPAGEPRVAGGPGIASTPGEISVPHSRMRSAIARRLSESKQTIPHFYVRGTARVDRLLALRAELNDSLDPQAQDGTRVSLNDLLVKAVARAHTSVPEMNVVWTPEAVRHLSDIDVAVAVATDGGLVTPVIRRVDSLGMASIATATKELSARARAGRLSPGDIEGGSITVTNLGMLGVEEFTAIINPPQSAILAVGRTGQEPAVIDGSLAVATTIHYVLSVDHRPIDGVVAARWVAAFTRLLEAPVGILL